MDRKYGQAAAWAEVATQNTNVAAVATRAAQVDMRHIITGYSVSVAAAPAAAVSVTLVSGATTFERVEIPAAAIDPLVVNFAAPLIGGVNTSVVLTIPAIGGVVRSTAVLRGYTTGI